MVTNNPLEIFNSFANHQHQMIKVTYHKSIEIRIDDRAITKSVSGDKSTVRH